MNTERMTALAASIRKAAEAMDVVGARLVVFLETFANELDKVSDEYMAERAEAMERHPAGKGRVDNDEPTREEMIAYVNRVLSNYPDKFKNLSSLWRDSRLEATSERTIRRYYRFLKSAGKEAGTDTD